MFFSSLNSILMEANPWCWNEFWYASYNMTRTNLCIFSYSASICIRQLCKWFAIRNSKIHLMIEMSNYVVAVSGRETADTFYLEQMNTIDKWILIRRFISNSSFVRQSVGVFSITVAVGGVIVILKNERVLHQSFEYSVSFLVGGNWKHSPVHV